MGSIPNLSILKGTQSEFEPKYLHRIFEEISTSAFANKAIIYNETYINYKELNELSNQIAHTILNLKLVNNEQPNSDGDWIVGVCLEPTKELLITLLAIWKAGAAYLPLDPSFPQNRFEHILTEAKPFLLIHDENIDILYSKTLLTVKVNELFETAKCASSTNLTNPQMLNEGKNDLGLALYTSGSTGIPKGVRLSHAAILNRLQWQWRRFPYSKTETTGVFKTALTFVDSVTEIWGPLLNGLTVLVVPKDVTKDPQKLVYLLEQHKIERLVLVPTLLRSILMFVSIAKEIKYLNHLKFWICSGEPLAISVAKEFYDYFEEGSHVLCNFYGSTEVMGDVTYFVCGGKQQLSRLEKIPIGTPVNNTLIYILDADYRPVKKGEVGEIFVSGLNLANGYIRGRDAHRFIENPLAVDSKYSRLYRTGDFGKIDKENVMYEGRTDSQVKIRGHRVDLSEIEKSLSTLNFIEKGIVLCYHPGEVDQTLLAFVTLTNDSNILNSLEIEAILKTKLTSYMVPQVVLVNSMPMLVNGKIDRQSLLKFYENTNNNDDQSIELEFDFDQVPTGFEHIAKDLFETVGSAIGRSTRMPLSLYSNFYALGGNSLNSVYTVTRLCEKGYKISITEFITAKTLGEVLTIICRNSLENSKDVEEYGISMTSAPLELDHKEQTIKIITTSFYGKADLEQWLKPNICVTDYADILEEIWEDLVGKGLSFIVKNNVGNIIGVALNFDAHDEPIVEVKSKLSIVFDFLEYIEGPIRDNALPNGLNKIFHSFMMGTSDDLNAQENIMVMHFMEREVIQMARQKSFYGILTTNTNPLTQQLGSDVYKYETMLNYQVNKYMHHDGTKPFAAAPDSQRAIVHWKKINH